MDDSPAALTPAAAPSPAPAPAPARSTQQAATETAGELAATGSGADGTGVAFYDFVDIPKPKPYKDEYRIRLDALPLPVDQKQRILEEVKIVFGLNSALFAELGADLAGYRR